MSFYVVGSGDEDTLIVEPDVRGGGTVVLRLPVQGLPWRDIRLVERYGPRDKYGCGDRDDPLVRVKATLEKPEQIADRTGIQGATVVHLENGVATVEIAPRATLLVPCLRVAEGARMPTAVQVTGRAARRARGTIRVAQLAGG
ncbi:MAG: hypothetical protein M3376_12620, partial [Actinomycetota bacterium]|nr:hypothetical protein [Actinomycetota bacterium]